MDEQQINVYAEDAEYLVNVMEESIAVVAVGSYNDLNDKPQINDVELIGNKTFEELGAESLTNIDIENIINSIV